MPCPLIHFPLVGGRSLRRHCVANIFCWHLRYAFLIAPRARAVAKSMAMRQRGNERMVIAPSIKKRKEVGEEKKKGSGFVSEL